MLRRVCYLGVTCSTQGFDLCSETYSEDKENWSPLKCSLESRFTTDLRVNRRAYFPLPLLSAVSVN